MASVYGVFHPVFMAVWRLYGIFDGSMKNHICSMSETHVLFLVLLIISWIYVLLVILFVVWFIPNNFGNVLQYFILILVPIYLVWLWGWFVWHIWWNEKHLNSMVFISGSWAFVSASSRFWCYWLGDFGVWSALPVCSSSWSYQLFSPNHNVCGPWWCTVYSLLPLSLVE